MEISSENKISNNPKISVIMATFNDPLDYLSLAIESIVNQTYEDWELLIVDDSTEVKVREQIDDYGRKDSRIIVIRGKEKFGFVKALNVGIKEAHGEYIARMDADDISKSNRLEQQIAFLNNHTDIDIVGTDIEIIDNEGKVSGNRKYKMELNKIKKYAFFRNPLAHPTVMYRRQTIINLNGYDENYKMAEDYELWLRALKCGIRISNIPEVLLSYRMGNDYYMKRSKENWKYNFLAKKKNYYWSVYNLLGIVLTMIMYNMPGSMIQKFYEIDRKKGENL